VHRVFHTSPSGKFGVKMAARDVVVDRKSEIEILHHLRMKFETHLCHSRHALGCIIWQGGVHRATGYGRLRRCKLFEKTCDLYAHRVAYMLKCNSVSLPLVNDAGKCLEVSHLCHNKLCMEPNHLIVETKGENTARKSCSLYILS